MSDRYIYGEFIGAPVGAMPFVQKMQVGRLSKKCKLGRLSKKCKLGVCPKSASWGDCPKSASWAFVQKVQVEKKALS
jgi:hypothetical protein